MHSVSAVMLHLCCIKREGRAVSPTTLAMIRRPHSFTNDRRTPVTGPVPVRDQCSRQWASCGLMQCSKRRFSGIPNRDNLSHERGGSSNAAAGFHSRAWRSRVLGDVRFMKQAPWMVQGPLDWDQRRRWAKPRSLN